MSSEKQFEYIENKIKEAVENNHIVFEEKSWIKMALLLNKKDKRKPFFWLWLLLPIALFSAYGIFTLSNYQNKGDISIAKNLPQIQVEKTSVIEPVSQKIAMQENIVNTKTNQANTIAATISSSSNKLAATNNFFDNTKKESNNSTYGTAFSKRKKIEKINSDNEEMQTDVEKNKKNTALLSKTKLNISNSTPEEDEINVANVEPKNTRNANALLPTTAKAETTLKKDSNILDVKNIITKKEYKKASNIISRFYLLAGAGADIGSVKLFSFYNSSFSAKYGVGVGYDFNKRLRLQTGIYASKKKYIAGPSDYNFKTGTYLSMVDITKIEAACLIYEIPLTMQYNFLQKKYINIYAGASMSSYFMKKEDYYYFYKRYNMNLHREYSYTGNQHLFSTALLSAGIEKNISKKIALQIEPTISFPLIGVGDGAVKLFSTSLQLGVKYYPFNR
jgi:Outer membrane protein beta-barrel domain